MTKEICKNCHWCKRIQDDPLCIYVCCFLMPEKRPPVLPDDFCPNFELSKQAEFEQRVSYQKWLNSQIEKLNKAYD